jgi:hypothetical protein
VVALGRPEAEDGRVNAALFAAIFRPVLSNCVSSFIATRTTFSSLLDAGKQESIVFRRVSIVRIDWMPLKEQIGSEQLARQFVSLHPNGNAKRILNCLAESRPPSQLAITLDDIHVHSRGIEELAGYLGYKGELVKTFVESIHHYNDLCKKEVDSDFGKDAKAMIPIDEPPFYGCTGQAGVVKSFGMVTLAGLVTDTKLRVLNKSGKPVKGLYVAGNTLGGRYGLGYTTPIAGNSIGMAMTHGWLAITLQNPDER